MEGFGLSPGQKMGEGLCSSFPSVPMLGVGTTPSMMIRVRTEGERQNTSRMANLEPGSSCWFGWFQREKLKREEGSE